MKSFQADSYEARLSNALSAQDWPLLARLCRQALRKNGRHLRAHRLLGYALHELREPDAALKAYRQGAAYFPDDAELLVNFAQVLLKEGQAGEAGPLLEKVCQLQPKHSVSWIKLSQSFYHAQQHEKGFAAAQKAAAFATTIAEKVAALNQLSIHRRELGQISEAVADCEEAIRLFPQDFSHHTNRLLFMLADPTVKAAQITAAAREFAAVYEGTLQVSWPDFAAQRQGPWRRLRVGFLSPDFRAHAVMYFIEGLLAQLDRSQFEVWAFYLYPKDDTATERVRCHADHFVRLAGMNPVEQATAIQDHQIDILIDLAGHTGQNGLLAMARKAAPVQVTTIGYPGTTGLRAMDWWISDAITDPPGADHLYVERLYRLPTRWTCYRPMSRNPLWRYQPAYQVQPTPALRNGFVTFGSCNNLGKLTDEVLTLWGQILRMVPDAHLLIEGKNLDQPDFAQTYRDRCARLGIDSSRLELIPVDPKQQYLTYHRIDVCLDPFPLVGGTTSNDLLWMGVPFVTLAGDSLSARMGVGTLTYMGRQEWIARNVDEYAEIAVGLAADVAALNKTRLGLRDEMENSVLMREDIFVKEFGRALRRMWMHWLTESAHPDWTAPQVAEQLAVWESEPPQYPALEFHVGIAPGKRIPLSQTYDRLQVLIDKAKQDTGPSEHSAATQLSNQHWRDATELAERILCAKPQDAVALTALAEIENAHGHGEFGRVYLSQALRTLAEPEPREQVLERTQMYVKAALSRLHGE